ncbi:fungal-specific transcription factor domain-containing protein [Acrodontium crateriforme]|uniref:Fungal-specific transcription factor domain-containing protein n=1 Tax=Acrodontium crateriforme TaxID=150365 RepID=A0AAQ3LY72_9PEZI|nr:fungal-specific transcription factor domain-containing protein [Acrodontium crateriforme]
MELDESQARQNSEGRPYRSHKFPACTACRHRKGRCHVDDHTQPCRYCRRRSLPCDHSLEVARRSSGKGNTARRLPYSERRSIAATTNLSVGSSPFPHSSFEEMQKPSESSPVMVDPTMADDLDVLERFLVAQNPAESAAAQRFVRVSNTSGESMVYRNVPRLRQGLQSTTSPGVAQREIIENIVRSLAPHVIKLYFDHINPSFPILDEASFWKLWHKDAKLISSTLMCELYAVTILYWDLSEHLRGLSRPDVQFVWNQAVLALRDDFMAPTLTTVHAALLDMLGRPIYHVTGNIINAGRTVSLARSQGLHRDSTAWRASEAEKSLRTRLWWGVLIHDHWSSLSHGTPPNIARDDHDVPLPKLESFLVSTAPEARQRALVSFYHLCRLTAILGDILPLVYSLALNYKEAWKKMRRIECALDEWEDSLPGYLSDGRQNDRRETAGKPWSSGLWFYYLTLRLMLNRLAFRITLRDKDQANAENKLYRFAELRKSASVLVDFTTSLQRDQFREFWLPYTAYLVVSAATTLLRCTVESSNPQEKNQSIVALVRFLNALRIARDDYDWDLASLCIETCGQSIMSIASATQTAMESVTANRGAVVSADVPQSPIDLHDPPMTTEPLAEDSILQLTLDIPWDHLWDDLAEPWLSDHC